MRILEITKRLYVPRNCILIFWCFLHKSELSWI